MTDRLTKLDQQMSPARWLPIFVILLLAWPEGSRAQRASNWRAYKVNDGQSFTSSLTVSPRGTIWAKSYEARAVNALDGYEVKFIPSSGPGNYRVYEGRAGQIWAADSAGLQEYRDGTWVSHPVVEIRTEYQTNTLRQSWPISLLPLKQGHVLFLLADRLMEFDNEFQTQVRLILHVNQTRLGRFWDLMPARDGSIWISGANGLARLPATGRVLKPEAEWHEYRVDSQIPVRDLQAMTEDDQGGITAVAESLVSRQKAIVFFDGQNWTVHETRGEKLRHAWRDVDGRFRFATINSLFHLDPENYQVMEDEDISAGSYFDVATEPGGIFWLATSEGLFRYAPLTWRTPDPIRHLNSLVNSIREDSANRLCFANANSLVTLADGRWQVHRFPDNQEFAFQATDSIYSLTNNTLVLEAGRRLLTFEIETGRFSFLPLDQATRIKPIGQVGPGKVCVQVFHGQENPGGYDLKVFDGTHFQPFPNAPTNLDLGNELFFLLPVRNGLCWLGGQHGIARLQEHQWQTFTTVDGSPPDEALAVLEVEEGKVLCGGRTKIWEYDGKNWSVVGYDFDRVNTLLKTRDGALWAADNNGIHRFLKGRWILNSLEEGLPGGVASALLEDRHGNLWAGTSRGLSRFHPEADADPPHTFVKKVITEKNVAEEPVVTIFFGGRDKWKFTPPERLLYSHRLDQQEWSPYQPETSVSYPDLKAGPHFFQVRAMDRNGNVDPKPIVQEFTMALPWYKETRLVLIAAGGLGIAIFFAALAFNRHRQLARSYSEVEEMVTLRTRQLEKANHELLQSQKMTALGTLTAGIAHDFNSILSIIKGSAQIIEDNPDNREKVLTRLDRIKTVVDQGAGIVKALLGFSRTSDQKLARCDINAVVEETVKLLGDRFQRELRIEVHPAPALPEVPIVQDFIQQMLLNFIFNAADAYAGPGKIILQTGRLAELPANLTLSPVATADYLFIAVQDFGCGIEAEIMPRIFEPFFTTKGFSARRGTGLGLSMVYELARKTGCGLTVESAVGQGSTFTILIPVRELPPDAPA